MTNLIRKSAAVYLLLAVLLTAGMAAAQKPLQAETEGAAIRTEKLASKLMARQMPYRVVLPPQYNADSAARFPVVYLLHGLTGHFDNWTEKTAVGTLADGVIIVTPEGGDGWYTDSATVTNDKYESYVVTELIPEIDRKFRTAGGRENRAIAGLSMGGYGAIKFGLKYPHLFSLVGSFSGAFDAPKRGIGGQKTWPSIASVYGPDDSPTRKANDIFVIAGGLAEERVKQLPFIYFDCGTEDLLLNTNREFAELLVSKKVAHEYRQLPGRHSWPYWEKQIREFLRLRAGISK